MGLLKRAHVRLLPILHVQAIFVCVQMGVPLSQGHCARLAVPIFAPRVVWVCLIYREPIACLVLALAVPACIKPLSARQQPIEFVRRVPHALPGHTMRLKRVRPRKTGCAHHALIV